MNSLCVCLPENVFYDAFPGQEAWDRRFSRQYLKHITVVLLAHLASDEKALVIPSFVSLQY